MSFLSCADIFFPNLILLNLKQCEIMNGLTDSPTSPRSAGTSWNTWLSVLKSGKLQENHDHSITFLSNLPKFWLHLSCIRLHYCHLFHLQNEVKPVPGRFNMFFILNNNRIDKKSSFINLPLCCLPVRENRKRKLI